MIFNRIWIASSDVVVAFGVPHRVNINVMSTEGAGVSQCCNLAGCSGMCGIWPPPDHAEFERLRTFGMRSLRCYMERSRKKRLR